MMNTHENSNLPAGAWSLERVLKTLEIRNAMSAMRGRPCPVAARVVSRLSA